MNIHFTFKLGYIALLTWVFILLRFRRRVATSTTLDGAVGPSRLDRPELQIVAPDKSDHVG